jgi:hypothetical protein
MANTVIQLKYSTVTATPPSLNVAEPAYSYTSNTLFIGTPGSDGVIAIGGRFYLDQQAEIYNLVNAAFSAANSAGSSELVVYAANHANAAYAQANTNATDIAELEGINTTQNTNITTAQTKADNSFHQANAAYAQANTNTTDITVIQGVNLTQNTNITNAQNSADAAFIRANNSLNANTGGTIDGDVTITGNLSVIGNTTSYNVVSFTVNDPIILLANNSFSDVLDIGFTAHYSKNSVTQLHTGLVRHAATDKYYLFEDYEPHILDDNILDVDNPSLVISTLKANLETQLITLNGQNLQTYVDNAYNKANTAETNSGTAQTKADNAFHQANAAYAQANTNSGDITAIQGVNLTQNTNITNAQNSADAAFIHSNAAFDKANTDYTEINISSADYGSASAVASFKVAANGRIISANSTSIALSASAITSGTLSVERGGTGAATHTLNGVLLGQGTGALTTASSSTEGHVLTINNSGVPTFAHLSGGTF